MASIVICMVMHGGVELPETALFLFALPRTRSPHVDLYGERDSLDSYKGGVLTDILQYA